MNKLAQILTYLGTIPFVFFAICLALNISSFPVFGDIKTALNVYGVIIVSFMAGVHWGQHLHLSSESETSSTWHEKLPIFSNLIAVSLWFSVLTFPSRFVLIFLVLCFTVLLVIDHLLAKDEIITKQYFNTRFIVTRIVVLALIACIVFY